MFKNNLWKMHRWLAQSLTIVRIALRVRNQCSMIISYHLHPSILHSENGEKALLKAVAQDVHFFIDVGANVGAWTALLLEIAPCPLHGLLFEPGHEASKALRKRFGDQDNLVIKEAALSNCSGYSQFYEVPDAGETSSIHDLPEHTGVTSRKVELRTLDVEMEERGWPNINMLKIDTEGHDFAVIQGALGCLSRQTIDFIQFEYNSSWKQANATLLQAMQVLNDAGYEVYRLNSEGLFLHQYKQFGEYYYYSNFVAMLPNKRKVVSHMIRSPF